MIATTSPAGRRMIAQLKGGLGNQLSILATGIAWSRRTGHTLCYDLSALEQDLYYRRSFEVEFLARAFGVAAGRCRGDEVRIGEALPVRTRLGLARPDLRLAGYYQDRRNFSAVLPEVATAIDRRAAVLGFDRHPLWREAATGPTVAVHFRRLHGVRHGERIAHPRLASLGSDYYRGALDLARRRLGDLRIFAFADDPGWLAGQDWLAGYDWLPGEAAAPAAAGSLFALGVMARCRAVVAANSSLSWWGGLLRSVTDPAALMVAPEMADWEPSITLGPEWRRVATDLPAGQFIHSSLPRHLRPADLQQDF